MAIRFFQWKVVLGGPEAYEFDFARSLLRLGSESLLARGFRDGYCHTNIRWSIESIVSIIFLFIRT